MQYLLVGRLKEQNQPNVMSISFSKGLKHLKRRVSARSDIQHCDPHEFEVSDSVIDAPQSIAFDQAEYRMHAQKAVVALTMK